MNNSLYEQFAAAFAADSLTSLVESFNSKVGSRGWCSARAYNDRALINELKKRGVDISAVSSEGRISFAHHVKLEDGRLVVID